jgi:hypothetical protein
VSGKRPELRWGALFIALLGALTRLALPALLPSGVLIAMAREGLLSIDPRRDLPR